MCLVTRVLPMRHSVGGGAVPNAGLEAPYARIKRAKGQQASHDPARARTARTIDLAVGEDSRRHRGVQRRTQPHRPIRLDGCKSDPSRQPTRGVCPYAAASVVTPARTAATGAAPAFPDQPELLFDPEAHDGAPGRRRLGDHGIGFNDPWGRGISAAMAHLGSRAHRRHPRRFPLGARAALVDPGLEAGRGDVVAGQTAELRAVAIQDVRGQSHHLQ